MEIHANRRMSMNIYDYSTCRGRQYGVCHHTFSFYALKGAGTSCVRDTNGKRVRRHTFCMPHCVSVLRCRAMYSYLYVGNAVASRV